MFHLMPPSKIRAGFSHGERLGSCLGTSKEGRVSGPEWGQVLEIAPNHCWVSIWVSKLRIMVIKSSDNQF
jgi:hypothetical protein